MPEQILFFVLAAIAVVSAFGVIFNRNVVHSALALLVNFGTVAMFYFMLNAQFLGIAQVLVYAGAIVVLFLFVVMLLGADLGEPVSSWVNPRNIFLTVLGLILLTVIGTTVFETPTFGAQSEVTQETVQQFGQTQVIGAALFTEFVLPFQLVAVLLSVGVIGVVWLAQHQGRQKFRKVIAVLDADWQGETEVVERGNAQRINWLRRQSIFDFDWIEIVNASDEQVQEFAAQMQEDADQWRRSRYRQMDCYVAEDCDLSAETRRTLRQMLGVVKPLKLK